MTIFSSPSALWKPSWWNPPLTTGHLAGSVTIARWRISSRLPVAGSSVVTMISCENRAAPATPSSGESSLRTRARPRTGTAPWLAARAPL